MAFKRKSKFVASAKSKELVKAEDIAKSKVTLSEQEINEIKDSAEDKTEIQQLSNELLNKKIHKAAVAEAKKSINKEVPIEYLNSRPSSGVTNGSVIYHMRETYKFTLGRKNPKPELIGLFAAASKLKTIVQGYYAGCPYAAWRLVQIEEAISNLKSVCKKTKTEAQALVNHSTSIILEKFEARRPTTVRLNFSEPYAYHIADILSQYDDTLRIMAKYKEKRFITVEEYKTIEDKMGRPLRHLLNLTAKWYYIGKESVENQDAQFLKAESVLGVLPQNIITGEKHPEMINKKIAKV